MRSSHPGPGRFTTRSGYWSAGNQSVDDHDHGNHEQQMDEPATDVYDEEAQDPKDEQYHRNRPKHFVRPR